MLMEWWGFVLVIVGVVWEGEGLPSKCCTALGCSIRCLLAKGDFSRGAPVLDSVVPGGMWRGCGAGEVYPSLRGCVVRSPALKPL